MTGAPTTEGSVTARGVVKGILRLPLAHRFRLAWRLGWHPRMPPRARLPLLLLVVYLAMPLDIVPDFIPVLGQLDDLLVIALAVWWLVRSAPLPLVAAEIENLAATPLGPVGKRLPWLLTAVALVALVGVGLWAWARWA